VEALLSQMTVAEKVSLLAGLDGFSTVPVPRLGVPSITTANGPHGVGADSPTTAFPTGSSFAASWNPELVRRVGSVMAAEARALGKHVLLGPCINIMRHPLAGRTFESLSEDPFLTARLAVAYVRGVQSQGVATSVKHFACNNQEVERMRSNSVVDERTLREIYLPAFEATVKEARAWTVMCSYNRLNGEYLAQNRRLLTEVLKDEWGFDGVVMSDWGAVHATLASLQAGLDLEMPGPGKWFRMELLRDAVVNWQVDEAQVNDALRRVLRLVDRCRAAPRRGPSGRINTPAHQQLAQRLAEEAITLLKNDSAVLPLDLRKVQTLAVIGPNAARTLIGGGGSSVVTPPHQVSILEGLRQRLGRGVRVIHEDGCQNESVLPELRGRFKCDYFANPDWAGRPAFTQTPGDADFWWWSTHPISLQPFSARVRGTFRVAQTGRYRFELWHPGCVRFAVDGRTVFRDDQKTFVGVRSATGIVALQAGRPYRLQLDCARRIPGEGVQMKLRLGLDEAAAADERIARAVAAARAADAAIVVVGGMPFVYEAEGRDRKNLDLPGRQDDLIGAVARANPKTIVVVNTGAPVTMPWADQVPGIVMAWYPGMEGGHAVARVLCGDVNPSGKLPMTFPRQLADTPAFNNYHDDSKWFMADGSCAFSDVPTANFPGDRDVRYGEGIFVGYRHYDHRQIEPLFPFGHGLSYTSFAYSGLKVGPDAVALTVRNTGARAGKETVQIYVRDVKASVARPPKELKGFAKVTLRPREVRTVTIPLDDRAFAFYDAAQRKWTIEPGEFEILVGSSSRDIRLRGVLTRRGTASGKGGRAH
jgi:beta-glucosidase